VDEPRVRLCFVGDRGYDAGPLLAQVAGAQQEFIVRACWNRRLATEGERTYLRQRLKRARVLGTVQLDVAAGYLRQMRTARLIVRAEVVSLSLVDRYCKKASTLDVTAIWVREEGTVPRGEKPLDWMLLTNRPARTLEQARATVSLYRHRWRIEEFHK